MDIGGGPHGQYQQQEGVPGEDGLIDMPGTPAPNPPAAPQGPAAGHHHQLNPAPAAPPASAAGPAVPKIANSNVNKIEETLDSKKNNWTTWSNSMRDLFDATDTVEYIEGSIPRPDPALDMVSFKNWRQNNGFAKMLIDNNIAVSEKTHTQGCRTAARAWQNLRAVYESEDQLVFTDQLQTIFQMRAQEGSNIADHVMNLKKQWDQLALFGENNRLMDDALFKRVIAQSLPRSWNQFTNPYVRGRVDEADRDPTTRVTGQQLVGFIKHEYNMIESQKKKEAASHKKNDKANTPLLDRISGPSTGKKGSSSNSNSNSNNKKTCKHCGRDNHILKQCRFLGKSKCPECELFHDGDKCPDIPSGSGSKRPWKGKDKDTDTSANKKKKQSHSADDNAQTAQSNVAVPVPGRFVSFTGDDEADASDDEMFDRRVDSYASSSKYTDRFYDWLADSGSTVHITSRRDAFDTYEDITRLPISGVGGIKTHAIGKGTIYLHSECDGNTHTLQLNNVLHVPSNQNNLLALGRWEDGAGRKVVLEWNKVILKTRDGESIAKGAKIKNNLYRISLQLAPNPSADIVCLNANTSHLPWEVWHRRFGHVGYSGLQNLLRLNIVDGFTVDASSLKPDCVACTEAKLFEAPYGPASDKQTKTGELTHTDLWGKYDVKSINGNQYYLLLVDDATRHITTEFLKSKKQAARKVIDYMTYLKVRGKSPRAIQMDRGTEFVNESLRDWSNTEGIQLQLTAPYSPSQNGVAERMNRTLVELSRAMLVASKLPEFLWEPAVAHAAYLRNMSYTTSLVNATPYQIWHGRKPNVSNLREFGAPVWVLMQGQTIQRKMLPKSQRRAYVGYDEGSKAIQYYNAATKNVLTSRNFRFLTPTEPSPPEEIIVEPDEQGENAPSNEGEEDRSTRSDEQESTTRKRKATDTDIDEREPIKTRGNRPDYKYLNDPFPDEIEAGIASVEKEEAFAVIPEEDECRNLREAKDSPEWPEWERAIHAELEQLERMGTWKLVDKPPGVVPIANKFIFAKKRDKEGNLLKYKARLVAKGCAQRPGYDFLETHSPVVRLETIRAILAIAPTRKLHIQQMDVKGAYLNGILKERVYMRQPEGYGDGTGRICLLIKTLYGLKQAGREWNIELDTKLRRRGYVRLRSDPCVYIWRVGEDFAIITVWVDDLLLFATTVILMEKMKTDIKSEWEVTDLGDPKKIVGIEITMGEDSITISSSKYIESILLKEGLGLADRVTTPLDPNVPIVPNPEGNVGDRSNSYARLLGEVQYIANATRPDIQYAVNRLASYTANPSLSHSMALKRILRYLSGTRSHGIRYTALPQDSDFFGYSDAAFMNAEDSKSTSGYVFLAGNGAITWCSKRQTIQAQSSTEAEYVALSETAREACWLRNLYSELGLLQEKNPTLIRGDNEGSLAMAKNPQFHKRSKHIDLRWHLIRELIQGGLITVESCRNPEQTADVLTKALPRPKHEKHTVEMGLASV